MKQSSAEKTKKKKGITQGRRAAGLMFALIIIITGLLNLALRDRLFSEPSFWMRVRAGTGLLTGQKESNAVFKGKDNYLLEAVKTPDGKQLADNMAAMKRFREAYPKVSFYMMLVPNTANILSDKLPSLAVTEDQTAQFKEIQKELGEDFVWVDVQKVLTQKKDKEIYYHTDPHWTTLGAYYAYQEFLKVTGIDPEEEPKLKRYAVTGDFSGSLSLASGYEAGYREPIYIYSVENAEEDTETVIDYVEDGRKTATIYDSSKLKETDKYAVFFGGDFPIMDIRTTADSTERLLVVKDSYANCLIPFLVPHYREIIVIDPALFAGDIDDIMSENRITRVLFLYSGNTFIEDNSISGVFADDKTE